MIVQSVSGNSFTGTVWGTTWTVNVATGNSAFYLRDGGEDMGAINVGQLRVGDEVGVSGIIDPNQPLTVDGSVVRNYSITGLRQNLHGQGENQNGGNGNDNGNGSSNSSENGGSVIGTSAAAGSSSVSNFRVELEQMLQQLQQLEGKLHGKSEGN